MGEDSHLEADYEGRTEVDIDDYDPNHDRFDPDFDPEIDEPNDADLERQELEDFEGLNGPFDDIFDTGGEW